MQPKPIEEELEQLRIKHPHEYESICNWIRTLVALDNTVINFESSSDTTEHPVDPPHPPRT